MKINGKEYIERDIDFNAVIELGNLGGDLFAYGDKPLAVMRAYLAHCGGMTADEAGAEITSHIIGGGELAELNKAFADACDRSDFFKAMVTRAEKAAAKAAE